MRSLYQSPLRVYLALLFLALLGVWAGMNLPVSLFPNSSKPTVAVHLSFGNLTSDEFLTAHGKKIESALRQTTVDGHAIDNLVAEYSRSNVQYELEFAWGTPGTQAVKEIESKMTSLVSGMTEEVRDSLGVYSWNQNSGFFVLMFYSQERSLDELYKYLDPILSPKMARVVDAEGVGLWNPNQKVIRLELNPEKMALLQILPDDVQRSLQGSIRSFSGGNVSIKDSSYAVVMDRQISSLEELNQLPIKASTGQIVHLGDIAQIEHGISTNHQIHKTSGASAVSLYGSPKADGNIKKMSEDIMSVIKEIEADLPRDISYRVIIDPSEFIRRAVNNVLHEVFIAAFLAVLVLFIFIGNIRNVITAAIEIPISIVLAFIMMKLFGINLNMISLGGLALSAGMNVDASVVVMENIFRRFEEWKGPLTAKDRINLVVEAVQEVKLPVIASTIASLVVFLPLALTSGLTNAVLGDLAMAVVFSHGFSAFIALILVPTVRMQMMSLEKGRHLGHSPIEKHLRKLENFYARAIFHFINNPRLKYGTYAALCASLALLIALVLPKLPKEIIGTPDTDFIRWNISSRDNTQSRQMEEQVDELEAKLLEKFGDKIAYTYTRIWNATDANVMIRLKDKSMGEKFKTSLEEEFTNTPTLTFRARKWNPSEMKIPTPPDLEISVRGDNSKERLRVADEVKEFLRNKKFYRDAWSTPSTDLVEVIKLKPATAQLFSRSTAITFEDVADLARVATDGRKIGSLPVDTVPTDILMKFPEKRVNSLEDLVALPIGVAGKIVPLNAFASVEVEREEPQLYRVDGQSLVKIEAYLSDDDKKNANKIATEAQNAIQGFLKEKNFGSGVSVTFEDAGRDLTKALDQLGVAVALSILFIFLTMIFQFGDIASAALVLVSIPLGFIGVLISLFVFGSTLSLNSALGVILLNGISVANSIILVDFLKRLVDQGVPPALAAQTAAKKRLRPILMTSLTTALGMMPIALGMGDGGKILQPLGIAVIGGLGFSMLTTLFVVPSLQVAYLEWRQFNRVMDEAAHAPIAAVTDGILPNIAPSSVSERDA